MTQRTADRREGDARVATGRLGDHVAGRDLSAGIGALQDVQRHPVLDAAGEVVRLVFGVDAVIAAAKPAVDLEQRRATDQPGKGQELALVRRGHWSRILAYGCRATLDA
jgi:hypothetical protein